MISSLVPVSKQRGLAHVQKLRVELQAIVDSKKVVRQVRKFDSSSRISFLKSNVKKAIA